MESYIVKKDFWTADRGAVKKGDTLTLDKETAYKWKELVRPTILTRPLIRKSKEDKHNG